MRLDVDVVMVRLFFVVVDFMVIVMVGLGVVGCSVF